MLMFDIFVFKNNNGVGEAQAEYWNRSVLIYS